MTKPFEVMAGDRILSIGVDADRQNYLRFVGDKRVYDFMCEGDCCSETWVWSVDLWGIDLKRRYPTVIGQEDLNLPRVLMDLVRKDGLCREEEDQVYASRIRTDQGSIDIIYRNSSNGYYGGDMRFLPDGAPPVVKWADISSGYEGTKVPE